MTATRRTLRDSWVRNVFLPIDWSPFRGLDHRFTFPRHGEGRRHRRSYPRPPSPSGTGFCRMASGASAHRRPTPNRGATRTARTVPASSPVPAAAGRPRRPPRAADSAGPGADCRLRSRQPTRRPDLQSTSGTHVVIDPGPHRRAARGRYVWTCRFSSSVLYRKWLLCRRRLWYCRSGPRRPWMANRYTRQVPALAADQRDELQRWLRRSKTSQALASRARIVLACAEGGSDLAVARDLRYDARDCRQMAAPLRAGRLRRVVGRAAPWRTAAHRGWRR